MKKLIIIFCGLILFSCQSNQSEMTSFSGEALGTEFNVQFFTDENWEVEKGMDSIFEVVNKSMSNYQDDSAISKINNGDTTIVVDEMFEEVFLLSQKIFEDSYGYFDPTVGNLVNAYGFGAQKEKQIEMDSIAVDSLMEFVGMDKVDIKDHKIRKEDDRIYLDFNGIAKGYAVDLMGDYLEEHGVENYLVEIGGEMKGKGKNLKSGRSWRLGIDDPRLETNPGELSGIIELKDKGMATSGNYRKYREDSITGEKYVHIINPKSGYTEKVNMLSVTVLADDVATADAYATAFMAMGVEKAIEVAKEVKGLDVFFIYDEEDELKTYASTGFEELLLEQE